MPFRIQIQIYRDLDPVDRWQRFHKPLDQSLQASGLGEVTGGGTLMDLDTDQVLYSDLTIRVTGDLDHALQLIRATLLNCGAPVGTRIFAEGGAEVGLKTH